MQSAWQKVPLKKPRWDISSFTYPTRAKTMVTLPYPHDLPFTQSFVAEFLIFRAGLWTSRGYSFLPFKDGGGNRFPAVLSFLFPPLDLVQVSPRHHSSTLNTKFWLLALVFAPVSPAPQKRHSRFPKPLYARSTIDIVQVILGTFPTSVWFKSGSQCHLFRSTIEPVCRS